MKKETKMVLIMLCLILSGALCFAHSEGRTENKEEGTPIVLVASSSTL